MIPGVSEPEAGTAERRRWVTPAVPRRPARLRRLPLLLVGAVGLVVLVVAALLWRAAPGGTTPLGPATRPAGALGPRLVPEPGQVGFLGDRHALTVLSPSTDPPDGSKWVGHLLRVDADVLSLDHVWVKGSIDFYGTGTLRISNSVVSGDGDFFATINTRQPGATLQVTDSTLTWPADAEPPSPSWGSGVINGAARMDVERCDISGAPDGIQQGGGRSRFEQNYIHDLRVFGTVPNNSHNDGLQFYEGPGIEVLYNRIELHGFDGVHQNSAVFFSGGSYQGPRVIGNYLSGGGYPLRIETGAHDVVVEDNVFGPLGGGFDFAVLRPGATLARWSGNKEASGAPVPPPGKD